MIKNIPKRRFKGFNDEWEEKRLGEITDIFKGIQKGLIEIFPKKSLDYPFPVFNGGKEVSGYTNEFNRENKIMISEGGASAGFVNYYENKYWSGGHNFTIENFTNDLNFIRFLLESNQTKLYALKVGSGLPNIQLLSIKKLKVFNTSLLEQQKIGDFFQKLDKQISLYYQKVNKLKDLKKSYLNKMFPKDNMLYPELRFKGFNDEWEEKKLGEVADVRDGTHDSPRYYLEGHPFITSKNIKNGLISFDEIQYISNNDFNKINKRSKVDKNDILMGMIGTIGNIALVREKPCFAIKNVALIKNTNKIYYLYLYHYLQSKGVFNQLSEGMDGGTQKFIALNKVRNLSICVSEKKEQQKIGSFFFKLDSLINLYEDKYNKLKDLKKAYLNEMFVNK